MVSKRPISKKNIMKNRKKYVSPTIEDCSKLTEGKKTNISNFPSGNCLPVREPCPPAVPCSPEVL